MIADALRYAACVSALRGARARARLCSATAVVALLLPAVLMSSPGAPVNPDSSGDLALATAAELRAAGRLQAAVEALLEAGRRSLAAQQNDEAVRLLTAAVESAPDAIPAHALLGSAYLRAGRHRPALEHLERAVAAGFSDPRTQFELATALWESERFDDAEQTLRRLLAAGHAVGPALHQIGRLLAWRGRPDEALEYLRRAAVLFADDAGVQLDLARTAAAAGEDETSLQAARRAAALAPELPAARYALALALARAGEAEAARIEREAAARLYSEAEARSRRLGLERAGLDQGWALLRRDKPAEAAVWFASLEKSPDALAGQAAALAATGDRAGAVRALERALAVAPEREDLRLTLAELRMVPQP